ncbi:MAG: carotenoid 1,2-hydratase [Betaproteobacteria bacterium]
MCSPYYARARRAGAADPEDFCAINVALYGAAGKRWTMTERAHRHMRRSAREFSVGPSFIAWDGNALTVSFDEWSVPLPQRVRGRVRLHPAGLCRHVTHLDEARRHRWGPIAPVARVEVELGSPACRWNGHAYFDSNEGDEPIDVPFIEWDWARMGLASGHTAVIYDVRQKQAPDRVLALRFAPDGGVEEFDAPPRHRLPRTLWRLAPTMRSQTAPLRRQWLEDTPFYARAVLDARVCGEPVVAMHETLDVGRLATRAVQSMLPFRMPRRG